MALIIRRVVRVVEGAALEMLCPERDLGFESLTLRQRITVILIQGCGLFFCFFYKWDSNPLGEAEHNRVFA